MSSRAADQHWRVFGSSQIGRGHQHRGVGNQDSLGWALRDVQRGFVASVADGHGGSAYFRSAVGSKLAVDAALAKLGWLDHEAPEAKALCQDLISDWVRRVYAHAEQNPWDDQRGDNHLLPYGSTLLAASVSSRWLASFQLGDGDLFLGFCGGDLQHVSSDQQQFEGEQTLSLCLEGAASLASFQLVDLDWAPEPPDFVMLSTDGVGKSFAHQSDFEKAAAQFRRICLDRQVRVQDIAESLPKWLDEVSTSGSGDDVTMVIAVRRDATDL